MKATRLPRGLICYAMSKGHGSKLGNPPRCAEFAFFLPTTFVLPEIRRAAAEFSASTNSE